MRLKTTIRIILLAFLLIGCSKNELNDNGQDISVNNKKQTGSSAHDILSDDKFTSMVLEIVYVEGQAPTEASITNFVNFIKARTYKPDGISVETRSIASSGIDKLSIEKIRDIEDDNRLFYNTGSTIALWTFFVDGASDQDTNESVILGTAYRNTSLVIFENTIQNFSSNNFASKRTLLETTVITHEFGHILGLTNFGTEMQSSHEDPEHSNHCNVESCLMYWTIESSIHFSSSTGLISAPQLDDLCIADLQANGGR